MPDAVDKERRGSIHSAAHSTEKIVSDPGRRIVPGRQCILQFGLRQSFGLCQAQKERQAEKILIFEDCVVHHPKFTMRSGEFSSLCGGFRVRMNLAQREMPAGDQIASARA